MLFKNFGILSMVFQLLCLFDEITGQFKIVTIGSENSTHPTPGSRNVSLVQIKPLVRVKNATSNELPSMAVHDSSRSQRQGAPQAEMAENKFIKLSIVNTSTVGSEKREGKLPQTVKNTRKAGLTEKSSYGDWVKAQNLSTNTKTVHVLGYAKKSKSRPTSRVAYQKESNFSAATTDPSPVRTRRYKYRNFKSRCRCERIWNCARIQISVARCAPDFFMCCF
uniref:Uncharacterized protein n=1 Tax=Anopheles dirus TaxID=7168 RepID=A0A182NY93_9DIPT